MSQAYKEAGVNIDAGNESSKRIKKYAERTYRSEVIEGIGGFNGCFALQSYKNPILVSSTDGVGTKLKIACELDCHETVGIDLVAMCVNDVVVRGAEPLFFLDYIATSKLDVMQVDRVVKGIAGGCLLAGCSLIGGETAEMSGMYQKSEYDLAGFCVGVVEKDYMIQNKNVASGDCIIGLSSSGLHSNGFSLVRKIFDVEMYKELKDILLEPTKIYVKTMLALMKHCTIKGAAHITGGGIVENIPRMLPEGMCAEVDATSWDIPSIFNLLQEKGKVTKEDMYRTFNMGIGMALLVSPHEVNDVISLSKQLGERPYIIGKVGHGEKGVTWV